MKVFLTGATGFVGKHMLRRLLAEGHAVRALVRDPQKAGSPALPNVEFVIGDIAEGTGLDQGMQECDAVIHLVGIIVEKGSNTLERVHHLGTRNVVEAAKRAGIKRFVQMSALGVRANGVINGPPPLNPPAQPAGNTVTAAKAFLGKTLFWDEQLSSTQTVACGTCHFASNGGSDARAIVGNPRSTNPGADGTFGTADDVFASPGVISNNGDGTYSLSPTYGFHEQVTGRKSRSYIDAGFSNSLFWDGRATSTFSDPIGGAVVLANGAALESQGGHDVP